MCGKILYYHPVRQLSRTIKYTPTSTLLALQTHKDTLKKQNKVVCTRDGCSLLMGVTGIRTRGRSRTTEAYFVVNPPGRAICRLNWVAVMLSVLFLGPSYSYINHDAVISPSPACPLLPCFSQPRCQLPCRVAVIFFSGRFGIAASQQIAEIGPVGCFSGPEHNRGIPP